MNFQDMNRRFEQNQEDFERQRDDAEWLREAEDAGLVPPYGPSRNGSKYCESGSIASGGTREFCTCDVCY
jgi:hypothetical protein